MKEPSILEYLQSVLKGQRPKRIEEYFQVDETKRSETPEKNRNHPKWQISWSMIAGCLFAMGAQYILENNRNNTGLAIILYGISALFLWKSCDTSFFEGFFSKVKAKAGSFNIAINPTYFLICFVFMIAAFLSFKDNRFTGWNVVLWAGALVFCVLSFWDERQKNQNKKRKPKKIIHIFLLIVTFSIAIFYRCYLLNQIPGEMFSDHAEKLLDIMDVLNGKYSIFFTRNTGREPLQFYLTAAIIRIFQTGIRFISLKIGMVLAGILTLPFIYLFGKQVANKWVGLIAMFLAGIAYWPNVISRVALRFSLYPLFTAPVLYYLFKGLQSKNRNDLILCGLFLGLGLHGYSPARILPVLVIAVFLLYWLHQKPLKITQIDFAQITVVAFCALMVFLPLLRYFIENPEYFNYRALSRLTPMENELEGSVVQIFLSNFWKSAVMFFYDNGQIWVHSIPHRPALDLVSAACVFIGCIVTLKQYFTFRKWEGLALLLSIPILLMPSILSLAFPDENPSLNRSGGAMVPIFVLAGIGLFSFARGVFHKKTPILRRIILGLLIAIAILFSMQQNYSLVFEEYSNQYIRNAWNTTEIGNAIAEFVSQGNSYENAYVVPFPHWVDTRLVGINAGFPWKDYALWPEDFEQTTGQAGKLLFIIKPEDGMSLEQLKQVHPAGLEEMVHSKVPDKNFIIYTVKDQNQGN